MVIPAKAGIHPLYNPLIEIIPIRILLFNRTNLPGSSPFLDLFLPSDGVANVVMDFIVNQAVDLVLLCKAPNCVRLVLVDSAHKVTRHASVKRAVPFARHYVDIIL